MAGLIWAAFRRQKALYGIWLLALSLAVTGLAIIDVYRQSMSQMIESQGRKILTADVSLSARRPLSEADHAQFVQTLPAGAELTEITEMMAMVSTASESRLALVRFVDDNYPLFGDLTVDTRGAVKGLDLADKPQIWVAPDLLALLPVQVGGPLRVGELDVVIAGVITKDSSQTFRFGGVAPRIYIHKKYLPQTKLLTFGSTYTHSYLALLATPAPTSLKKTLEKKFSDPAISVTTPEDLEQGSLRVLTRLLDFLGLIGLVTLTLGWIGVYYLGRRWLALERGSAALLKSLGMSSEEMQRLLLAKLSLILLAGVLFGGVVSWIGAQAVFPLFQNSLPPEFRLLWSWQSTGLLLAIGPLAGFLLLSEPIREVAFERPLRLLSANVQSSSLNWRAILTLIGLVALLFVALTFLQARSWRVTGIFLASLVVCVALISSCAWMALAFVRRVRRLKHGGWRWHLASAQWLGRPGTAVLLVTVSALAGLLAQLVPHLETTLIADLQAPTQAERPAVFLFDVQDEQRQPLIDLLHESQVMVSQQSPFIRARILSVNGNDYERTQTGQWSTREEEMDARMRNRGVNLSYRPELSPSEKIFSGKPYADLLPSEVSVEKDYAARLGLKLGDHLVFDVQGVEVQATVGNLREINWDSFQPNFFIQFRDTALEAAPKTWIMTIKRHPTLKAPQIQRLISRQFANVSSINVAETLDSLMEMIRKMSSGLQVASRLALALGVFVFLMILLFQLLSSQQDWAQLQMQGLTPVQIWQLQVISFGALALLGSLAGTVLSAAVSWGLAHFAFGANASLDGAKVVSILLSTLGLSMAGLTWISWRQSRQIRRTLRSETVL